jgi:hypothetical protein
VGIFGRRVSGGGDRGKSARTIPHLNPSYYQELEVLIESWGGSEAFNGIAFGVGNAVFNTGCKILTSFDQRADLRRFVAAFENRHTNDVEAADKMIDYLVTVAPESNELLTTLLGRLREVYSRPPG